MDAIFLLVTEFTEEMLWLEFSCLSFVGAFYLYFYVIKKRDKVDPEWVSGAVVKDYLDGVRNHETSLRMQLFGETGGASTVTVSGGTDPALLQQMEALRVQLATSDKTIETKQKELDEIKVRLEEYEVIEDDLANLKKYQMENKKLREQVEGLDGTPEAGVSAAAAPVAEAPAAEAEAPAAKAEAGEGEAKEGEEEKKDGEEDLLSEFEKMLAS